MDIKNKKSYVLKIKIVDTQYVYDKIECKEHINKNQEKFCNKHVVNHQKKLIIAMDCVYVYYLIKEIITNLNYRRNFLLNFKNYRQITFVLKPTKIDLIDYNW